MISHSRVIGQHANIYETSDVMSYLKALKWHRQFPWHLARSGGSWRVSPHLAPLPRLSPTDNAVLYEVATGFKANLLELHFVGWVTPHEADLVPILGEA